MPDKAPLRVVIFRDGEFWVAQCIELDIGAQARDLNELKKRFDLTFDIEKKESIDAAPDVFAEMWEKVADDFRATDGSDEQRYEFALAA